jgi:hypothetical protein
MKLPIEDDFNFVIVQSFRWQVFSGLNFTHFDTESRHLQPQQMQDYIYRAYPDAEQLVFPPSVFPQQ